MAARLQLVKVPGVGGPVTELAARPVVAVGAVAVALVTRVDPPTAWGPAATLLAQMRLEGCRGVAPVAQLHGERRGGGVPAAVDSPKDAAGRALDGGGVGLRAIVVLGADGAHSRAIDGMLANVASLARLVTDATRSGVVGAGSCEHTQLSGWKGDVLTGACLQSR
eukprot:3383805-Prymnesium_polylepis.2